MGLLDLLFFLLYFVIKFYFLFFYFTIFFFFSFKIFLIIFETSNLTITMSLVTIPKNKLYGIDIINFFLKRNSCFILTSTIDSVRNKNYQRNELSKSSTPSSDPVSHEIKLLSLMVNDIISVGKKLTQCVLLACYVLSFLLF